MIAALAVSLQGCAMAEMTLFSAVQGQVLEAGKPLAGASVERSWRWTWKKENGADAATTDAAGSFSLPRVARRSFLGGLVPHEPFVEQTILIRHNGRSYKAWMMDKRDYDNDSESGGKPLRLVCRLEAPFARHGQMSGICEFV
jgi:hypothetical protein